MRELKGYLTKKNEHIIALEKERKAHMSHPATLFDSNLDDRASKYGSNASSIVDSESLYSAPPRAEVIARQIAIQESSLAHVLSQVKASEVEVASLQSKRDHITIDIDNLTVHLNNLQVSNHYQAQPNSQQYIYNVFGPTTMPTPTPIPTVNLPLVNAPTSAPINLPHRPAPSHPQIARPQYRNKCTRRRCRSGRHIHCKFVHPEQSEVLGRDFCNSLPRH